MPSRRPTPQPQPKVRVHQIGTPLNSNMIKYSREQWKTLDHPHPKTFPNMKDHNIVAEDRRSHGTKVHRLENRKK